MLCEMLRIYFEESIPIQNVRSTRAHQTTVMAVNIHIAASSLTNTGFALATASFVAAGMNLSLELNSLAGRRAGRCCWGYWFYMALCRKRQIVRRLHITCPAYYSALYAQELEMMYFLIEPLFERAEAFNAQWVSDGENCRHHHQDDSIIMMSLIKGFSDGYSGR